MPLPNIKNQCTATARSTGNQCLNPTIGQCKTCRYHGGRKNILSGKDHPNFKHGQETKEAKADRQQKFAELNALANNLGLDLRKRKYSEN